LRRASPRFSTCLPRFYPAVPPIDATPDQGGRVP